MRIQSIWRKGVLAAIICGLAVFSPSIALADCGFSIQAIVYTDASCGQSDGTAQVVLSSGAPAVAYQWSSGGNTATVSGLSAGIHTVTVTDGVCTVIEQVFIENIGAAVISNITTNAATCQQNNGSAAFNLSGNGSFGIAWTGAASGSLSGVGAGVANVSNLVAGDYTFTVTDANGCVSFAQTTVPRTGGITANFSEVQNTTCGGGANGILRAQATSGSLPFEFFINGVSQGTFFSNTFDFTGLTAGTYVLTVEESGGCTVSQTMILDEAGSVTLNPANFAFTNVSCPSGNDGTATAVACPACDVYNLETGLLVGNMAATVNGLTAGEYEVRLYTTGCLSTLPFTITDPARWEASLSASNPTCTAGQADITVEAAGGTGSSYTYLWSDGSTNQDLTDVFPGAYTVTVTDVAGCNFSPDAVTITPCNSTEVITVFTNSMVTFCVDTADVAGNVTSVFNLCPGAVNNGTFNPIGFDGCITYTASFQEGFDTICVEVCGAGGFACDTTTVVFQIESPADTIFTYISTNQQAVVCPPLVALPGSVTSATNLSCSVLSFGSVSNIDQSTGCVTYDAGSLMGQDMFCVLFCDGQGFCDTAVMVFQVISPIDTQDVFVYTGQQTTFCPDLSAFTNAVASAVNLNCAALSNGSLDNISQVDGCITFTGNNIAGTDQVCIEVCDGQGNCDTTVFQINIVPQPDTVYLVLPAGSGAVDTCAYNLQFPGMLVGVTNLGCDNNLVGTVTVGLGGCVNYVPPTSVPNSGTRSDTVCLVYCDNSSPVAFCDTVIFIFDNTEPDCSTPEIPASITVQHTDCDLGDVCLPIPLDSIGGYSLEINGNPYNGSLTGCDIIRRMQYPLVLVPPCSNDYSITWVVDGVTFGPTVVTGFSGIVSQLNTWDGNTAWSLANNPTRIVGVTGNDQLAYGDLSVSCVGSSANPINIGVSEQAQYAQGTNVDFGSSNNTYTLTVTNPLGCVDVASVDIYCVQSEIINDTIEIGQTETFCGFDQSQLPANIVSISNACPSSNGNVTFSFDAGSLCVTFTGDTLGPDLACVILCASNGICDTTYFFVEVIAPAPTAVNDTVELVFNTNSLSFDVCANDIFTASAPLSITALTQPLHGSITNNNCDFTYTVNGDFCGQDSFTYVMVNGGNTDTATVYVETPCKPFSISEGISPNNDGFNDFFVINSLTDYPDHEIFVFNRWGSRVFRATNYQNDWNAAFDGRDLPDGTYFYVIYLNNPEGEIVTGYLIIQR